MMETIIRKHRSGTARVGAIAGSSSSQTRSGNRHLHLLQKTRVDLDCSLNRRCGAADPTVLRFRSARLARFRA